MKTEIEVKQVKGHFEVYVKGKFYCTCDPEELSETLEEIEKELTACQN